MSIKTLICIGTQLTDVTLGMSDVK